MFYIISIGPGNPELITVQAINTLEKCDIVFVPVRTKELSWVGSIAYKILSNIKINMQAKLHPLYTPMNYSSEAWNKQVEVIAEACKNNNRVGYVTMGDAAVYSSAYYLLNIIKEKYSSIYAETEVIPGITSFSYASAKVKKPLCLGDSGLEIVPMHGNETKPTKVYMRLHKGDEIKDNIYYFRNLGLEGEVFGRGTPGIIEKYLTLLIDFQEE